MKLLSDLSRSPCCEEYNRLNLGSLNFSALKKGPWRVTTINYSYTVCSRYIVHVMAAASVPLINFPISLHFFLSPSNSSSISPLFSLFTFHFLSPAFFHYPPSLPPPLSLPPSLPFSLPSFPPSLPSYLPPSLHPLHTAIQQL